MLCKNCRFKSIWKTNLPFHYKLLAPFFLSNSTMEECCFWNMKASRNKFTGQLEVTEEVDKKQVLNYNGNCEHYIKD